MTRYYLTTDSMRTLLVATITDDLGWQVRNQMFGVGLLESVRHSPVFPKSLEHLVCRLNSKRCHFNNKGASIWTNRLGDTLCLPAPGWEDAWSLARVRFPTTQAESALEARYGTCSVVGTSCHDYVVSRARYIDAGDRATVFSLAKAYAPKLTPTLDSCLNAPHVGNLSALLTRRGLEFLDPSLLARLSPSIVSSARERDTPHVEHVASAIASAETLKAPESSATEKTQSPAGLLSADQQEATRLRPLRSGLSLHQFGTDFNNLVAGRLDATIHPYQADRLSIQLAAELWSPQPSAVAHSAPTASGGAPVHDVHSQALRDINLPVETSQLSSDISAPLAKIGVIVFDFDPNPCHPVIIEATGAKETKECSSATDSTIDWQHIDTQLDPIGTNHATHVSGLIAGRYGIGVDPNVRLQLVRLAADGSKVTIYDEAVEQRVIQTVGDPARQHFTRVVNLSVDLNTRIPQLNVVTEKAFDDDHDMLFVAAAGDRSEALGRPCDVVPACFSSKHGQNLIVVGGALNFQGHWSLSPRSGYGDAVDLVAPSDDIVSAGGLSTVIGVMSGTSQSAALVSGVAARLFGTPPPEASDWSGAQIRNRLMATTSHIPEFDGKAALGLLDAARALDVEHSTLVGVTPTILHVKVTNVGPTQADPKPLLVFTPSKGTQQMPVDFCTVYRLSHDKLTNLWTVAYEVPIAGSAVARWTEMKVYRNLILPDDGRSIYFRDLTHNSDDHIAFSDLSDFYADFSTDRPCAL
jgi:hypothetical protein